MHGQRAFSKFCSFHTALHSFCEKTSKIPSKSREDFISLCSIGSLKEAFKRFQSEIWSDPSLFSHLLQACIPKQSLSLAKQLHSLIITSGSSSDRFISNHLLNVYAKCGQLTMAAALFDVMPRKNVMSSNILIGGFIQNGDLELAQKVFHEMPERNVATWNAMVTGLIQFGLNEDGLDLFYQMQRLGLQPDEFTLGSVLRGSAGLKRTESGQQIHTYIIKSGFHSNLCVGSSLAHMYMKCGCVKEGEQVFAGMPVHNVVACNTVIAGRAQNGDAEGALDQFNLMKLTGFRPDQITFVSIISSCSELATLGQGQQVHAQAIKAGADSEVSVRSSLVNMYSKCGCLDDSKRAFLEYEDLDIVLWSSMISAYGFHGHGQEAIGLFERMENEGIELNDVTFLGLLYACCHSGLKEQAAEFFKLMTEKYELQPRLEHYTCMVDLLGRSGCLDEAEALIRSMPVKPDAVIWKTLLSACKIHRNAEMASRIAEHVLRLDPGDSAPYVLLSNIHASEKKWGDVTEVRRAMRERKVKKEPGISWFEVKNQVHQFCMGDQSHPKWREIDAYLKELMAEIKEHGYVPDTASVLHDMEVEEKEHSLAHHSEKLAIAFALLSIPSKAPIRIMKNLRVCNDCHVAIKFISKITVREIIVRDASRFHHFKDGECSCSDYW
ncbi:pentatricopeptide repeat-containing protein At2g41080 [Magnolia sinica]|uniref:pentatricopeptide repeat-containing protein At2g41080 n=1 Tax=Magnolia sinica TaxID=86752 RepID=UPI00265A6406|nr:pentatricopeptide repeat-containing protein At2g41080 [Magnolia sinica]